MKIERSKNASRNIIFGTMLKVYQIALPFIMRTVMTYELGVQYLGLNSLFTSVLQVLNLAELGVGSAMVFSMYKPIVEDDSKKICALMRLYKIYYNIIGAVILIIGVVLLPFIPNLISGDVPEDINVYILYLMNVAATVLTYWLFAYKNSILQAHQRTDISSKITIVTDTIKYVLQIGALVAFQDYYLYVIAILMTQVFNNIITAIIAQKMYPDYMPKGKLLKSERKDINQRIKDLFTSKFGGTIINSADSIVISAFLGLEVLAIYQNYFYIINAVIGFITIVYSSITAGVGNSMLVKDLKQNYREFEIFTLLSAWLNGFCICCFIVLFQPFMRLWMGDNLLLDFSLVILLCIYFWFYELVMMISVYKDAGGIWHEDRYRPLTSGIINIVLNIILVHVIGLYGIIISSIISICCVSLPWIINNVFKILFKSSSKYYMIRILMYSLIVALVSFITYLITNVIPGNGWITLFIKCFVIIIVANCMFLLLFRHNEYYKDAKNLIIKMFNFNKIIKYFNRSKTN